MQRIDGYNVHIIVPNDLLAEIDRIAKRQGLTRSETIRILTDCGVTVYKDFEKVGVVRISEMFSRMKKIMQKGVGQQRLPIT